MNWIRYYWTAFGLWLLIRQFRFMGWMHGLPSLNKYTDEQIIEGLRQLYEVRKSGGGQ